MWIKYVKGMGAGGGIVADLTVASRPGFSPCLFVVVGNLTDGRLNHAKQN